jgi:hypothetical protein
LYDTVFTRVDVERADRNVDSINFVDQTIVTKWISLTNEWLNEDHPFQETSLDFYTAVHKRDEGMRVDLEIINGIGLEINVYVKDCHYRQIPIQHWCFPGMVCEIPMPEIHDHGSFYPRFSIPSVIDSPFESTTMRIVVRGFDTTYRIRQTQDTDSCSGLDDDEAPFCAHYGENRIDMWGDKFTFPEKDYSSKELFESLRLRFSCPLEDNCNCKELSDECIKWLTIFSCHTIFGRCDDDGYEKHVDYKTCLKVEDVCEKTFTSVDLPNYNCNHNFYHDGIKFVDPDDIPVNDDTDEFTVDGRGGLHPGFIVLIVLAILLFILIVLVAAYFIYTQVGRNAMQLGPEDEYQQMKGEGGGSFTFF